MLQKSPSFYPGEPRKIGLRDFRELINKFLTAAHKRDKSVRKVCNPSSHEKLDGEQVAIATASYRKIASRMLRKVQLEECVLELERVSSNAETKTRAVERHHEGFESAKCRLARKRAQLVSLR